MLHLPDLGCPPAEHLLNAFLLAGPAYVLALRLRWSPRGTRVILFAGLAALSFGLVLDVAASVPALSGLPLVDGSPGTGRSIETAGLAFGLFLILISCLRLIERSRAERASLLASREEARLSGDRFRELFHGMRDAVFESEASGRFVSVNPACLELLGYETLEEIRGVDIPTQLYVDPGDRLRLQERVLRDGFVRDHEVRLRRRDGVIIRARVNSTASRDAEGRLKGFRGTIQNVTEERAAEEEIRRLQELNRNIIESLSHGILVMDRNLRTVLCNRAFERILRVPRDRVIGRTPWDGMSSAVGPGMEERIQRALDGQTVTRERVSLTPDDGPVAYVSDTYSPLRDSDGEIVGVIGFIEDLTARTQLEQQLIQAEKVAAIGQMVSGIAHEINNPLTSVSGYAQLLLASDVSTEVKDDLQKIADAAERCGQVVRGLLTYGRKHEHRMTPVDLADALERTYELKAYELSVEDITVERDYDPGLPLVRGDRYQLQQVVLNLLQNAGDAIRENGRNGVIRLTARSRGRRIVIGVFNSGPPIPEEVIRRVFDPFYTTKEVGRGTGLGLSVAQNIVRAHEGTIRVRNVTGGVLFEVDIPALQPEDPPQPVDTGLADVADDVSLDRARILVVDDEATIQDLFVSALPDAQVTTVDCGKAALAALRSGAWDAVVTDIKMPGGVSGLDLLDWVRENRPDLAGRMVLMTGAALEGSGTHVMLPPGTPLLLKPFGLADLRSRVAVAVGLPAAATP